MKNVLQIPSDVGEHCHAAARVLEKARRDLEHEFEAALCNDEGFVTLAPREAMRLANSLAQAAAFLAWLAAHGEHEQPIERVEAAHEHG